MCAAAYECGTPTRSQHPSLLGITETITEEEKAAEVAAAEEFAAWRAAAPARAEPVVVEPVISQSQSQRLRSPRHSGTLTCWSKWLE